MKFTLYYDGPLPSAANDPRTKAKHCIRKKFHPQLLQLFRVHPALPKIDKAIVEDWDNWSKWKWPFKKNEWDSSWHEERAVTKIGDLHFLPLIRSSLDLICEIDILFLRTGEPGVMERGARLDIDNRLLTLFDALTLPVGDKARNHAIADTTLSRTSPNFCLLEDDSRIVALNVRTDRLLAPAHENSNADGVRLIIGVTVKATRLTFDNLEMAS
jgi:hypothetical protein